MTRSIKELCKGIAIVEIVAASGYGKTTLVKSAMKKNGFKKNYNSANGTSFYDGFSFIEDDNDSYICLIEVDNIPWGVPDNWDSDKILDLISVARPEFIDDILPKTVCIIFLAHTPSIKDNVVFKQSFSKEFCKRSIVERDGVVNEKFLNAIELHHKWLDYTIYSEIKMFNLGRSNEHLNWLAIKNAFMSLKDFEPVEFSHFQRLEQEKSIRNINVCKMRFCEIIKIIEDYEKNS